MNKSLCLKVFPLQNIEKLFSLMGLFYEGGVSERSCLLGRTSTCSNTGSVICEPRDREASVTKCHLSALVARNPRGKRILRAK